MQEPTKLKCVEVHQGLSEKEIRDYLATMTTLCYDEGAYVEGAYVDIEIARREFATAQKRLEASERLQALKSLTAKQGWAHFDVSDNVADFDGRSATGTRRYMGFIGTNKEHLERFINHDS
jgi:hypothetical protein